MGHWYCIICYIGNVCGRCVTRDASAFSWFARLADFKWLVFIWSTRLLMINEWQRAFLIPCLFGFYWYKCEAIVCRISGTVVLIEVLCRWNLLLVVCFLLKRNVHSVFSDWIIIFLSLLLISMNATNSIEWLDTSNLWEIANLVWCLTLYCSGEFLIYGDGGAENEAQINFKCSKKKFENS